ncbi:MAG: ATP-binding cassette domain-containing protein [Fibromonadaceae bacterium]|jgi:phospholipid/cholesterol/gamma-HCH transport system ATP-binding protein|nr:ATP-binding cassette domain-containing protein [Fibromonadaceae bacterium]
MSTLSVSHLKAGYGKKVVLHDVSFSMEQGEIRAILGTSGCGKSTLLNNILGLEKAMDGEIEILGTKLKAGKELIPISVQKRTGVLFQSSALLSSLTVFQNVALPIRLHRPETPKSEIRDMVASRLEKVNMLHAIDKLPSELSGGMKKRAALARAIALDPELLFCDEPSAGLDPVTSRSLDDLLLSLREHLKLSILIVTHELDSIKTIADKILFLKTGEVLLNCGLKEGLESELADVKEFFSRTASH